MKCVGASEGGNAGSGRGSGGEGKEGLPRGEREREEGSRRAARCSRLARASQSEQLCGSPPQAAATDSLRPTSVEPAKPYSRWLLAVGGTNWTTAQAVPFFWRHQSPGKTNSRNLFALLRDRSLL